MLNIKELSFIRQLSIIRQNTIRLAAAALECDGLDSIAKNGYENGASFNNMRVARYLKRSETAIQKNEEQGKRLLYGAHSDYTGFTFLWRSRTNGLQVKLPSAAGGCAAYENQDSSVKEDSHESWFDVPCGEENELVINAGDLIKDITNGVWRSCVHRVVDLEAEDSCKTDLKSLISIAFFSGPSNETVVEIVPDSDKCRKYGRLDLESTNNLGITAGEHLMRKINASNVVLSE